MNLAIHENYESLSNAAANQIIEVVRQKPCAVLCLAAGDTPRLAYTLMVNTVKTEGLDFANCTFIGLDEWLGISPCNEGSCHHFLKHHIFEPLNISNDKIRLFDALTADPQGECRKMDKAIIENKGIDLMLVGIGMNGHVGFNEPAGSFQAYSHVVVLDETSRTVGQKYFREQTILTSGITLGLGHMMEARKVILVANGKKKADIIRRTLEEDVTPFLPASLIRNHVDANVILDREAGSLLTPR
jgi:glucosamine-6-phosphate isomerase